MYVPRVQRFWYNGRRKVRNLRSSRLSSLWRPSHRLRRR